jgi:hypothetical protein
MLLLGTDRIEGTEEQLARICGCTGQEMSASLVEMQTMQIALVRMHNGCITIRSRRLSRIKDVSNLRRKAAQTRWCKRDASAMHGVNANDDAPSASASASSSILVSKKKRKPSTQDELLKYAKEKGISESDAIAFYDSMEAGGWTRNAKPLADWQAHLRSYKAQRWLASQKNGSRKEVPERPDAKVERSEQLRLETETRLRAEGKIK